MKKSIGTEITSHESIIDVLVIKHFKEKPKSIRRMTMGICNEVYNVVLRDKEIIARLSSVDYFLKGSHYHIPKLKELGLNVPDILAEDYSKIDIPYSYQFLSKFNGTDIGLIIENLSDEQLKTIAKEISFVFDKTKTLPTSDKFGVVWGDFAELSNSWTERMRIWIDETIERGSRTGIIDKKLQLILINLYDRYQSYFDQLKPVTYLGDISSKNVMIHNGVFVGLVDLDGLTQGDPLEAIGRIKASWPGTHHGEIYTKAIMDAQKLDIGKRRMVLVYALLNRISWASENGIQFNQNTSTKVDSERAVRDKNAISILLKEYELH